MGDMNSGEPWSDLSISDLNWMIASGDCIAAIAAFLCRDEDEVRAKVIELDLLTKAQARVR